MRKILHNITPWLSVILFGIAAVIIHHKLRQYHYRDIAAELRNMPARYVLAAIALTFLDYLILTGYDTLALFYIGYRLPYRKIAVASFVGYVFSHNATILGGSAARYRIYSGLGLSAGQVARLILFCSITFWLGFLALGGFTFVLHPQAIEHGTHLPFKTTWPIGVIFLILLATYLIVTVLRKKPVTISDWDLAIPSPGLSLCQIALASIDWAVAGSVLYVLLSNTIQMDYPEFIEIFLLAQITGLVSSVPGGLGVFEGVMLLLLSEVAPASSLIGSLLLYRVIYYLLPLGLASIILGIEEMSAQRNAKTIRGVNRQMGRYAHTTGVRRRQYGRGYNPAHIRRSAGGKQPYGNNTRHTAAVGGGNIALPRQHRRRRTDHTRKRSAAPAGCRVSPYGNTVRRGHCVFACQGLRL